MRILYIYRNNRTLEPEMKDLVVFKQFSSTGIMIWLIYGRIRRLEIQLKLGDAGIRPLLAKHTQHFGIDLAGVSVRSLANSRHELELGRVKIQSGPRGKGIHHLQHPLRFGYSTGEYVC
jgi:hypothetical protein